MSSGSHGLNLWSSIMLIHLEVKILLHVYMYHLIPGWWTWGYSGSWIYSHFRVFFSLNFLLFNSSWFKSLLRHLRMTSTDYKILYYNLFPSPFHIDHSLSLLTCTSHLSTYFLYYLFFMCSQLHQSGTLNLE